VESEPSSPVEWTPEQVEQGKRMVRIWKVAGEAMERLRREELRTLDSYKTIALLCGPADYTREPFAPKPTSGLVEQQRWFSKLRKKSGGFTESDKGEQPTVRNGR
jgi:hypothetical protein